jgi:hypothetical protein
VVLLKVRDRYGAFAEVSFRVDTQADVTTMPISLARKEAIPFGTTRPGTARGIAGKVARYRDRIHLVIAGREHDWSCDFTEPVLDPQTQRPLPDLAPVLGRAGFLDEYALTIGAGFLVIARLGPVRRWWQRWLHAFWQAFGMIHSPDRPL